MIEVECPDCGTRYSVGNVHTTVMRDGEARFWCPADTCSDWPVSIERNLVGDVDVEISR